MSSGIDCIAPNLRVFIEPQMEQLRFSMKPQSFGITGRSTYDNASGYCWIASIGNDVLLNAHYIQPSTTIPLVETPDDYACVCQVSRATLECTPVQQPKHAYERDNLAAFIQPGGTTVCDLKAGSVYESRNITFTPRFIERIKSTYPTDFEHLEEDLARARVNELAPELHTLMQAITPQRAMLPGAEVFFTAKVLEAASLLVSSSAEAHHARDLEGTQRQIQLVHKACQLIDTHLDQALSLDQLAAELYVSRTRLCAAFRQEKYMSIGAYIKKQRITHAQRLLVSDRLSIAEVARSVGYPRQSSFTYAFKQETGLSPREWQKQFK